MAIPDYQTVMLPLLRLAADGSEHKFRDAVEKLAQEFLLTSEERSELLPSGTAPLFDNRVGWARTYLKQAGLLSSPRRGATKGVFITTSSYSRDANEYVNLSVRRSSSSAARNSLA